MYSAWPCPKVGQYCAQNGRPDWWHTGDGCAATDLRVMEDGLVYVGRRELERAAGFGVWASQREEKGVFVLAESVLAGPGHAGVAAKNVAVGAANDGDGGSASVALFVERLGVVSVTTAAVQQRELLGAGQKRSHVIEQRLVAIGRDDLRLGR